MTKLFEEHQSNPRHPTLSPNRDRLVAASPLRVFYPPQHAHYGLAKQLQHLEAQKRFQALAQACREEEMREVTGHPEITEKAKAVGKRGVEQWAEWERERKLKQFEGLREKKR